MLDQLLQPLNSSPNFASEPDQDCLGWPPCLTQDLHGEEVHRKCKIIFNARIELARVSWPFACADFTHRDTNMFMIFWSYWSIRQTSPRSQTRIASADYGRWEGGAFARTGWSLCQDRAVLAQDFWTPGLLDFWTPGSQHLAHLGGDANRECKIIFNDRLELATVSWPNLQARAPISKIQKCLISFPGHSSLHPTSRQSHRTAFAVYDLWSRPIG